MGHLKILASQGTRTYFLLADIFNGEAVCTREEIGFFLFSLQFLTGCCLFIGTLMRETTLGR